MIRKYAPIALIPAAWVMTFATVVYPEIDSYWIEHMHYFMLVFLTGFSMVSWTEMSENPVLRIWRNVIGAGVIFTAMGSLSFILTDFSQVLAMASIVYWFLGPGVALYLSSSYMEKYSELYKVLGFLSVISFLVFMLGNFTTGYIPNINEAKALSIVIIAGVQTLSIVIASLLDR